jgi:hypothetical protein
MRVYRNFTDKIYDDFENNEAHDTEEKPVEEEKEEKN